MLCYLISDVPLMLEYLRNIESHNNNRTDADFVHRQQPNAFRLY